MMSLIKKVTERFRGQNLAPRAFSLLLAVILWAYISDSKTGELKFKIPVSYENLPANMTVSYVSHKNIIATLQGKNEHLKNIQIKNIRAVVDLTKPEVGKTKKYSVRMVKKEIPENIKIDFDRKVVDITVEMVVYQKVRVMPKVFGNVNKDFFVGKILVEPEFILAEGPRSVVENIKTVFTRDISIAGAGENIIKDVELNLSNYKGVSFSEQSVRVKIPIIKYGNLYRLEVPIVIRNATGKYSYTLSVSAVKVYVKTTDKRRLVVDDIDASIDMSREKPEKLLKGKNAVEKVYPVRTLFKNNSVTADIISIAPERVKVKIEKKDND